MYTGLGEYPGYVCYDKDRPSWQPFWWDTWSESVCKLKQAPANIAACVNPFSTTCASSKEPGSYLNVREDVFGGTPGTPNLDPNVSGSGIAQEGEPDNMPTPPKGLVEGNLPILAVIVAGLAFFAWARG